MTYRRDQEAADRRLVRDAVLIDWQRAGTQGNFPRTHSAKAAPHPLAGVTKPPKPRRSVTTPVHIVDEIVDKPLFWIET